MDSFSLNEVWLVGHRMGAQFDLFSACTTGDAVAVRNAIAQGVNPTGVFYGDYMEAPLHIACRYSQDDDVLWLTSL